MLEPEGITVSQACQRLGVSERTLRRLIRTPEMQEGLLAVNRRIGGRNRQVLLLSPALMMALQAHFAENSDSNETADEATGSQPAAASTMPLLSYERLLAEKDARLAELATALAQEKEQNAQLMALLSAQRPSSAGGQRSLWRRLLGWD